jgi:hypothetical protein
VQNVRSFISVSLYLSSTHYARWRDNVLLTLGCYSLSDHVLLDTTYVGVPAWDRMDSVVKSWIWGTISPDLQDITRQRGHTARDTWLALENHFLGNHETRTLHINATFRSFVQGDLSINYYCRKMKGFTDSLADLGVDVTNHVLVLNVLHGLNKNFEHLYVIFTGFTDSLADLGVDVTNHVLVLNVLHGLNKNFEHLYVIFTHATPFPSFQKVLDDLCLEEIQQGIQGLPAAASSPTALYATQKPPSSSSSASNPTCVRRL